MRSFRRISVGNRANSNFSSNTGVNLSQKPSSVEQGTSSNFSFIASSFQSESSSNQEPNPRHISISYASSDHDLLYESVVLFFSLSSFFLQLLHLYRTVWWLPQSYEQNAVKFYLVNPYLIGYVISLISQRWLWTCSKTFISNLVPHSWQKKAKECCRVLVLSALTVIHFYCISFLTSDEEDESYVKVNKTFRIACLLYPSFVMGATFQEEVKNYVELVSDVNEVTEHTAGGKNIQHKCSNDPIQVRNEVEILRQDFNHRIRNVLFHSYITAVVCALLPCCFAQTFVHFDFYIAIQHFFLVWAGHFTLNAVNAFPPQYCEVLHSSARHLGYWDHIGSNSTPNVQCVEWCSTQVWKQGSVVRCDNEIYRARSDLNSAEPGSIHHERFYALFVNAAFFQISLLVGQLALVILQLVLLFRSSEWHQMISLSLMQASGGYALFKFMRDSVVVWRLSLAEEMLKNV